MADKPAKPDKDKAKGKSKDKAGKKGKKGKKAAGGPSVATHPRAVASVRRAKGAGGLAGFALAALLSHRAGLDAAHRPPRATPAPSPTSDVRRTAAPDRS